MQFENVEHKHYPALDGLRGIAILLVIVYHNFGFIDIFFIGWLGVDLFFVLSGFLITDILLKTYCKKNFLSNFYIRRALRIFPLYYLTLFIFLIVLPHFNPPIHLKYYLDNQAWFWVYLQNWLLVLKNPTYASALNHLWSLAVEEQFYLLWPLAFLVLRNPKTILIFIVLLLLTANGLRLWIWNLHIPNLAYFNLYTFTRIDGLCIGCMVALLQKTNNNFLKKNTALIVLFIALVNLVFFIVNRRNQFTFPYLALAGYSTIAMMFGLLVNEAVIRKNTLLNFITAIPLLKFFGKISYGLYIFHWPIFLLLGPYLSSRIYSDSFIKSFTISLTCALVSVLISWLVYQYYERYFLNLKAKFV